MRQTWCRAIALVGLVTLTAGPAIADSTDEPGDEPGPAEVGYKKGFFITSGDGNFSLVTQGRVQGRFTFESLEGADERIEEESFSIARARLTLKGHAFSPDIKYKFQSDFGKGNVVLKDFYVDWKVGGGAAIVRVGQYKRPFSRQQINSSGKLELVDRAITDKAFGGGRDIGVMVHNNYEKSPELEWAVGVFNGTGDKPVFSGEADMDGVVSGGFSNVPDQMQPAVVARAGINRGGIKGYSEADLEGGPTRFAVAASVLAAFDNDADDSSAVRAEIDGVVKNDGLSASGAVYVSTAQDGDGFADQALDLFGVHAQVGYMVSATLQPVGRYAVVIPDADDAEPTHEITGGVSLYEFAHGFKWQTDIGASIADGVTDFLARTQLQLSF